MIGLINVPFARCDARAVSVTAVSHTPGGCSQYIFVDTLPPCSKPGPCHPSQGGPMSLRLFLALGLGLPHYFHLKRSGIFWALSQCSGMSWNILEYSVCCFLLKLAHHFLKEAVPAKAVAPSLVTLSPLPSWQLSPSGKALVIDWLHKPNILEHEGRILSDVLTAQHLAQSSYVISVC